MLSSAKRNTNTWQLNNIFLTSQQVTEELKREIKNFLETNNNENTTTKHLWDAVYSNTILPQGIRKTSSRQPNFTPETTGKNKNLPNYQKEKNHKDTSINK